MTTLVEPRPAQSSLLPPPTTVVLVPWREREDQPERTRVAKIVFEHLAGLHLPVVFGDSDPRLPFVLSQARNNAAREAAHEYDWDIAIFCDADVVAPLDKLLRAVAHARLSGRVTLPWDYYYSMSEAGHNLGLDRDNPIGTRSAELDWIAHSYYRGQLYCPGGLMVVPRAVFDHVEGFDEDFLHWGPEDAAFLVSVGEFDRLSGPAYHFWHHWSYPSKTLLPSPWPTYVDRVDSVRQHLIDELRDINGFGTWSFPVT